MAEAPVGAVDRVAERFQDLGAGSDLLVPALVAVALLLGLAGFAGWWYLRRGSGNRLRRILGGRDEVAVLMHPNPDPDAMASAMAVAHLARMEDTTATLQYPGQIRHQENRAFRTVLDLDVDRIATVSDLAAEDVVLVDHNEARGFEGAEEIEPLAVIDHHPGDGSGELLTDVRTTYGACATILVEYLEDVGVRIVPPDEQDADPKTLPAGVATGLLYGILADTKHLTKGCSTAEFEAAARLYPGIDEDRLDRIANPQVSEEVLVLKASAIHEKEVRGSFAVCDLGAVGNVDAIPQAADELMHLEGLTATIVFGDKEGTLHISGRSRDDRVHMGETIRSVVADIPMADGGGHARMGGGQVSVEHMQGLGPQEGLTREEFVDALFAAMAGDQ